MCIALKIKEIQYMTAKKNDQDIHVQGIYKYCVIFQVKHYTFEL